MENKPAPKFIKVNGAVYRLALLSEEASLKEQESAKQLFHDYMEKDKLFYAAAAEYERARKGPQPTSPDEFAAYDAHTDALYDNTVSAAKAAMTAMNVWLDSISR